jgi:hypothetical protein
MSCPTITETLKKLRDAGMSPAKLKQVKAAMEEIHKERSSHVSIFDMINKDGTVAPIKIGFGHSPLRMGTLNITEQESISKYQSAVVKWTQSMTDFKIRSNEDLPDLTPELAVIAALYSEKRDEIYMVSEGYDQRLEQKLRGKIYNEYINESIIKSEDFNEEHMNAINIMHNADIKALVKYVVSTIEGEGRMSELSHEAVHAGAIKFMKDEKNKDSAQMKRMEDLYQFALSKEKIIDVGMVNKEQISQYWMTNIHEFVAEGLSNPLFINVLSKIQYKNESKLSTIFKEFISTLISMLGVKDKVAYNIHEYLLDSYASILEEQVGDKNRIAISEKILISNPKYIEMANRHVANKDVLSNALGGTMSLEEAIGIADKYENKDC